MPLQSTSGAASYDGFGGGTVAKVNYIEDFFQSYLRTGTGASATVTTGLDGSTKETLVWTKSRSAATAHKLTDNVRGATKALSSNTTGSEATDSQGLTAFSATGYTLGTNTDYNNSGATYVDWQWISQPKFFDVVTYTGNGTTQNIAHNLGSAPGCVIVKTTSNAGYNWAVYHRSLSSGDNLRLNTTDSSSGAALGPGGFGDNTSVVAPTSTVFTVGNNGNLNNSGFTYVAYLFAHNAGGFGLTGTDNVISCGSLTTDSGGNATVNLGYEPQWILYKRTNSATNGDWFLTDNMRGLANSYSAGGVLNPNLSAAETGTYAFINATGFSVAEVNSSPYIYIAIRRGPMKVPTDATKVFQPIIDTGDTIETSTATFPLDMQFNTLYNQSNATYNNQINDRLRGIGFAPSFTTTPHLTTASTAAETTSSTYLAFKGNGMDVTKDTGWGATAGLFYNFRRAPSFFDEVCYTGTGTSTALVYHNLGVNPELIIQKRRDSTSNWYTATASGGSIDKTLLLNTTGATGQTQAVLYTSETYIGAFDSTAGNISGATYVAYLFATCAGVQYINSYVGDGTTGRTINCGFTGGARFVCIKATSTTGSWWTFDSARGIVTNNDPALQLNSTAAEVTSADAIDTASSGFIVNQEATCSLNASGVTYSVWAIA